jgi:hypothetical protein
MTDKDGKLKFDGFLGEYELTFDGKQKPFSLAKEDAATTVIRL